ncbi:GerAB/ArcD/ProY family transporter [Paenibacillus glycinis]|uniref:Endospore germination permease n=1 Tax=Paenibacillus glycinis TaxID=2697035 RepID=A0ABW9XI04_9BACL|nr:endospore germination permease [Paenibacillus glycinis]NBD22247.1 endospore germination permease [Paenibacillus glycinis]
MKTEKLTQWQFVIMISISVLGTEIFNIAAFPAQFAGQDAWISVLIAPITSFWCIAVCTALARRYPDMTIIEYSRSILGSWVSTLVEAYYLCFLFVYATVISKALADLIAMISHQLTPHAIILLMLLAVCGTAAWCGIGVIGRCGEIIFPIMIVIATMILLISIRDWNVTYLQPVAEKGLPSILRGASVPSGWLGETVLIAFLIPFLNQPGQARKASYYSTLIITVFMLKTVLICTLAEGPLVTKFPFPYAALIRYISLGDMLERLDPVFFPIWVSVGFIKLATFLFVACLCVSRISRVKNQRTITLPVVLLVFAGTTGIMKDAPGMDAILQFYVYTFPVASFVAANAIPTVLLVVDWTYSRRRALHEA